MIYITKGRKTDIKQSLAIAESLPKYFTPKALSSIRKDLAGHPFYIAMDDSGQIFGFASITQTNKKVAELRWLAVSKDHQRQGIGFAIVNAACRHFRSRGFKLLLVKTLSKKARYKPYNASRRFYEKVGFIHIATIDPYPDWDPGNPCSIYTRIL
jgi:GNAT superfamily N-acetyltransferase